MWDFPPSVQSPLRQEQNATRENETAVWNWRRWKQIQKCNTLTHDGSVKVSGCSTRQKFTVFECFSRLFTPSSTFAKVRFALNVQIIFGNGNPFSPTTFPHEKEKNCGTSFGYGRLCDFLFCFERNILSDTVPAWFFLLLFYFISFFIPDSTCKGKEIIFREANVLANLYCRMIRVSLFLFFTSLWNIGRKNWWHNWSCFWFCRPSVKMSRFLKRRLPPSVHESISRSLSLQESFACSPQGLETCLCCRCLPCDLLQKNLSF